MLNFEIKTYYLTVTTVCDRCKFEFSRSDTWFQEIEHTRKKSGIPPVDVDFGK
jgi:hypothetical protein